MTQQPVLAVQMDSFDKGAATEFFHLWQRVVPAAYQQQDAWTQKVRLLQQLR